jgi:hypothetical protein
MIPRTEIWIGKRQKSIKISAKETLGLYGRKQHKHQRKQDKMQWLQYPNQSNLNTI